MKNASLVLRLRINHHSTLIHLLISMNTWLFVTAVKMTEQMNNRFYEKRFIAREWFVRTGKPLMTAINEYVKSKEENASALNYT